MTQPLPQEAFSRTDFRKGTKIGDWQYVGNTTKPGDPKWNEWENTKTGQKTLKIHEPQQVSTFDTCDHYWEVIDNGGDVACVKCHLGKRLAWGMLIIKDHKIYNPRTQEYVG